MIGKSRLSGSGRARATAIGMLSLAVVLGAAIGAQAKESKKYQDRVKAGRAAKLRKAQQKAPMPGLAGTGTPARAPGTAVGSDEGPHPVIEAMEPVYDFGTEWIGPQLQHTFKIKNAGDKTLEITRVKPSCGCTVAGNYPRKIEPGETGDFPFSIASTKLRGRFQKSITVSSNDPVTPDLRLALKGEVRRYVDVSPANANFGKIIGQDKQTRILNITNNTDKKLSASISPTTDGKFAYELVETEPGTKYELRVTANPPFEPGTLSSRVTLKTGIDKQPEITISSRATVPARLDLQPTLIALRSMPNRGSDSRGISRVVRFTNYGINPVDVLGASVDDPSVTATVNERTKGKAYTVLVQFPPGYEVPDGGKTLTIKTNDKKEPELHVRIQGPRTRTAQRTVRPAEQLVGQRAPSFSIKTTKGKSLSNADFKGITTVIDFFAPNCPHCAHQIPRLEAIRKQYEGKPVRFVALAQTMRQRYPDSAVFDKINELGFKGELALDLDNNIGPAFQATSYPTMVIIDGTGRIAAVNVGDMGDLESRVKTQLDALVAGKPIPGVAKAAPRNRTPVKKQPTMLGKAAPEFSASTLDGKSFSTNDFSKYKATVVDFFAPNCPHCKRQLPMVEQIRQKYASKGIRFVAVSQKMGKAYSQDDVMAKLNTAGYKGEVVINHTNSIGQEFGTRGFPTMFIVGKDGKIGAVNVGDIADLEKRTSEQLDAALAGKPFPEYAAAKPATRRRPAEGLVGSQAPAFSLTTVDGKQIGSADFSNHPATVLNFVAPDCPFCKRQIPNVEKIRAKYVAKGVRFINVSQTLHRPFSKEDMIGAFKKVGSGFELAKDDGNKVGREYKAVSFPTMIVVDRNGKITNVNVGAKADIDTLLQQQLDALISKAG